MAAEMTFFQWLEKMVTAKETIGPDHAMREFVSGLYGYGKLYHFEDSPNDIFDLKTKKRTFTDREASLLNKIVTDLMCEEMFTLACQLNESGTPEFQAALIDATELMDMMPELEITSALKQAGADHGIPYGVQMGVFVEWATAKILEGKT